MGGFTKEQRVAKAAAAARTKMLKEASLTEEQFEAFADEEKAALLAGAEEGGGDGNEVEYVDMVRDESSHPAPHTAQVHPDEVLNYAVGGWTLA